MLDKLKCWLGLHDESCTWGEPFNPSHHAGFDYEAQAMLLRRVYYFECRRCGAKRQEEGYLVETI